MKAAVTVPLLAAAAVATTALVGTARGALPPTSVALSLALAGAAAGVAWARAASRPELEVFGAVVRRGRHPGRLAVLVEVDRPDALPAALPQLGGTTVFLPPAALGLAEAVRAAGAEPGLLAPGGSLPEAGPRWVLPARRVGPRLFREARARGLSVVWPSVDLAGLPPARVAERGAAAVATDLVRLRLSEVDRLPALRAEWASRAIAVAPLSAVLEPDAPACHRPGSG